MAKEEPEEIVAYRQEQNLPFGEAAAELRSQQFHYPFNVYGTAVQISLQPPVVKQVEAASSNLPDTGAASSTVVVLLVAGLAIFFYIRNRQLATEIRLLRHDYHGGLS